jgi:hypothetical protein
MGHFGSVRHLVLRFLGSLIKPKRIERTKQELFSKLNEEEKHLFEHQSVTDQNHSLRSVKHLYKIMDAEPHADLVIATALHDIGKTQSQLGVSGRVLATCVASICGVGRVHSWGSKRKGTMLNKISVYVMHPEIGAQMLEDVGSSQLAIVWARDHHKSKEESSIEGTLFTALHKADRA